MRHDKMVSISQENSRIKVEIAKHEIKNMLENYCNKFSEENGIF